METISVYKLFRQDSDGQLHSLFIDSIPSLPTRQWIEARAPSELVLMYLPIGYALIHMDDGKVLVKQQQRPTITEISLAQPLQARWVEVRQTKRGRRYYDIGLSTDNHVLRFAHHPGWHTTREPTLTTVNMDGKVWAECLIPADGYHIRKLNINGMTAVSQPVEWLISDKIYIDKVL